MKPRISEAFEESADVRLWIKKNHRLLAIAGTILSVVHPLQYEAGMAVLDHIRSNPEAVSDESFFEEILAGWGCPFTEFVVTSNYKIPAYRSQTGRMDWFDLNMSVGRYSGGSIALPDINMNFKYSTGTAMAISTRILQHSVLPTDSGDRMSFKFSIRENMVQWAGVRPFSMFSSTDIM